MRRLIADAARLEKRVDETSDKVKSGSPLRTRPVTETVVVGNP